MTRRVQQSAPSDAPNSVDVRRFMDEAPFSLYQQLLVGLCFMVAFADGFGTQAVAVVAPSLRAEMNLQPVQLGTIFAAGMLGGIAAAFAMAPVADRIGRRSLLAASVLASAVLSAAHALADTFGQLVALRLAVGVSLAVAVTVTYTYAAEIAPRRAAATAVMVSSAGFGLGVAAAGFLSSPLLNLFGWRSIFYACGLGTFALSVLVLVAMPESVRYLAQRDGHDPRIRKFLTRIQPHAILPPSASFRLDEEQPSTAPLVSVLAGGRAYIAIPMWLSFFSMSFVIFVFMQWLPILVTTEGGGAERAGEAVGWFKLSGVAGGFLCAAVLARSRNQYAILATVLLFACGAFASMSAVSAASGMFTAIVAVGGLLLNGALYASNGLLGSLFPTYVRGGGLALTAGIGRAGAVAGSFLVGVLLQDGWTVSLVLQVVPIPLFASMLIVAALSVRVRALRAGVD